MDERKVSVRLLDSEHACPYQGMKLRVTSEDGEEVIVTLRKNESESPTCAGWLARLVGGIPVWRRDIRDRLARIFVTRRRK